MLNYVNNIINEICNIFYIKITQKNICNINLYNFYFYKYIVSFL